MRIPNACMTLVLIAGLLSAQDKPAEAKPPAMQGNEQAAIINVKTLSGDSFTRLANMIDVFNVRYRADSKLRTIVVYAAPDVIAQIRKVVEELDRPGSEAAIGRNIEMTLTFLRASTKPPSNSVDLPADMEAVAKQLRAVTQYKAIELWDILPIRIQEGKRVEQYFRLPGSLPNATGAITTGRLDILPEAVTRKDSGRYVRFDRFDVRLSIPYATNDQGNFRHMDVMLGTAGEFKEGQKTVVGKLSGSVDETATFVVLSLKVLE
ncbi:MAG TPA: hypothetical protein VER03_17610 [Bryobacteraceae bacterium]|nr:hypothetical protein [Bryobacteraceae bacterium]